MADAKTLVQIVLCRILGGDPTLVSEIEQRRTALERTDQGRATQGFLLAQPTQRVNEPLEVEKFNGMPTGFRFLDDSQRQVVAKEVVELTLQRERQDLKRQRVEDLVGRYRFLREIGVELDPRTLIEIRDNVSLRTKKDLAIEASQSPIPCLTQDSKTLGAQERGHETGIVVVSAKMGVRVPPAMSGPVGKLMKALYKKKYDLPADWNGFVKRQTLFRGRPIYENCYFRAKLKISQ